MIVKYVSLGKIYLIIDHLHQTLQELKPFVPHAIYDNFFDNRKKLRKKHKGDKKGYVYLIVNKINGKRYVGSTRSISSRFSNYFNLASARVQKNRPIASAFLKYGLLNFSFIILEVVDLDIHNLEKRETYWILKIKPEYNSTKFAARNINVSHSK